MLMLGTAGWNIPRVVVDEFPESGSGLARYSARFGAVEVNSSFHRSHRATTWSRWGDAVPEDFRFAVKVPKVITHERGLVDCDEALARFISEAGSLGAKLGVILVQLPPRLTFNVRTAGRFFETMQRLANASIVCEPRHSSWFEPYPDRFLRDLRIARVAADPAPVPQAAQPGGWTNLIYRRLHGSPVVYRSSYAEEQLQDYAYRISQEMAEAEQAWCIFDNTASAAAAQNALRLKDLFEARPDLSRR